MRIVYLLIRVGGILNLKEGYFLVMRVMMGKFLLFLS